MCNGVVHVKGLIRVKGLDSCKRVCLCNGIFHLRKGKLSAYCRNIGRVSLVPHGNHQPVQKGELCGSTGLVLFKAIQALSVYWHLQSYTYAFG